MASCFKIPIMVEVMRRVDAGALRLDDRLTLTEADKSPGSTLIHCQEGLRPSVRDLLYLMITLSDNTATDMLWRLVGLGSVNETMRLLGLQTIDCSLPNREYFLIESGAGDEWAGLTGPEIVARWREIEARGEREDALRRVLEDNARLSGAGFLHLYERRWGRDESLGYEDSFVVDQALDNQCSPRDMAELLAMIAQDHCASTPSCRLMVEVMSRQEWREKIPAGLPDGLLVANKTGGVSGTSNDAAIAYTPCGAPLVMVVFWKGLAREAKGRADAAIAAIAADPLRAPRGAGVNVAGARILVVGGVHRLGRALALDLAGHGAALAVSSRTQGEAAGAQVAALRAAGAPAAAAIAGDARLPAGAARLVADAEAALGGLDALVYAASGPFVPTPPQEIDEASWDASLDTIAKGFFFTACAAHERLAPGGAIVAITDYLGVQPWASFAAHGAAKAAQIHLVKELARAWAPDGIRVCGVAPGPVDLEDDEHRAATLRAAAKVAAERLVTPADIGAAVRFCLETEGVTGVNVAVDNGSLVMS